MTWDMIGYIDVTPVSLKFWRQFDERISIRRHRKGTPGYKLLTDYVRSWANKIVLQLVKGTPKDYVLVECANKETGEPYGPRGMVRSLEAALGVIDAYKGMIPPNWGHPIPGSPRGSNEIAPVQQPPRIPQIGDNHGASPNVHNQQGFAMDSFRYRYAGN